MNFELFIATRYLRARRKQVIISFITLVSVLGVMTGTAALIIILSMYAGMSQDLQRKLLGATAHITVLPVGGGTLSALETLQQKIGALGEVTHVAPAVYVQAMISSSSASTGLVLKGIDINREKAVTTAFAHLQAGSFDSLSEGHRIIIGRELAIKLGVSPGSFLNVIIPRGVLSPLGITPRVSRFQVAGVFETGLYDFDSGWAYIDIEQARRLAGLESGSAQALEIRVRDIYGVTAVQKKIKDALGTGIESTNWIEMNKPLFSALQLEKWGMFLAIGLIVLVASLNIVTTLILMVMEKGRDIAILRAMGSRTGQIMRVFIYQGLLIGGVGTLLGDVLGITIAMLSDHYKWIHLNAQVYSIPYLPFHVQTWDVVVVSAVAMFISFAATLFPSVQAGVLLDPVEAIRYA